MSKIKRAYRYRFYPTDEQRSILARTFGCTRYVYNWALRLKQETYLQTGRGLSYKQLSSALTTLKEQQETSFLGDVSCVPLQQGLRHLARAYLNFFEGRASYQTFKDGTLTLAKMDAPLSIVWSRNLPKGATPSTVTVSRDQAGRYFVSLLMEEESTHLPNTPNQIGIDLGLKTMVITSYGQTFDNPRYFARDEKKLAKAHRRHARKQKGSKNREKARRRVAKLHARIADRRRDYQHKLSTRLIRENQTICCESLSVKNMTQHPRLSKAIADVGWGEFVRQLEYKAAWYGRSVIKIDRCYPSSKTCSVCGHVLDSLDLECREWMCPACSTRHDRDINAALSVLAEETGTRASDRRGVPRVPVVGQVNNATSRLVYVHAKIVTKIIVSVLSLRFWVG